MIRINDRTLVLREDRILYYPILVSLIDAAQNDNSTSLELHFSLSGQSGLPATRYLYWKLSRNIEAAIEDGAALQECLQNKVLERVFIASDDATR